MIKKEIGSRLDSEIKLLIKRDRQRRVVMPVWLNKFYGLNVKNHFLSSIAAVSLILMIFIKPALATNPITTLTPDIAQIKLSLVAELPYEVKENTSLENPVVDPNFNQMRNEDMGSIQASIIVVGVLLIATIVPVVTWLYFSRQF